jgi:hypothetical protein
MKRFIYILLGIISTITPILISINDNKLASEVLLIAMSTYLGYLLVSIFWVLFYGILKDGEPPNPSYNIPFLFWPFALRRKKVYYSDLGYFYISFKDGEVNVYKQTPLMSHFLFNVSFGGDVNRLRVAIKNHLDDIYHRELEQMRNKRELKNSLKKWDGYIDLKSKRDDKLDKLL